MEQYHLASPLNHGPGGAVRDGENFFVRSNMVIPNIIIQPALKFAWYVNHLTTNTAFGFLKNKLEIINIVW